MAEDGDPVVAAENLRKHYPVRRGLLRREVERVRAVDGVDFALGRDEALGLVGESGSGKSTVARLVLGLEAPTAGEVRFDGRSVSDLDGDALTRFRRRIGAVFQDPTSSFDPRMTVGESVGEPMRAHGLSDDERRGERVAALLDMVGLAPESAERYPHELSGGQKQRAALARALALDPDVLVLDEPVSALDVSVQAGILSLIEDLRSAFDLSVLLISHDMSVVRDVCDRVAVMYAGGLVERAPTDRLFAAPKHPYTSALLEAVIDVTGRDAADLPALDGAVPDPTDPPAGCRFHPRCPDVIRPDGTDLSQSVWRSLVSLRVDLRTERFDPGLLDSDGTVSERVRTAYDLPDELEDGDLERRLSAVLADLADGDREGATRRAAAAFSSPCTDECPRERDVDGHAVACHLYPAATDQSEAE